MPTIKDALDIIDKLTIAVQESLKAMLLSPTFVKTLNIEFLTFVLSTFKTDKCRDLSNRPVVPLVA